MLVMSRKLSERIRIDLGDGRYVWVTVVSVKGDKIRLGFEAPKDIQIWREEIIPFRKLERESS